MLRKFAKKAMFAALLGAMAIAGNMGLTSQAACTNDNRGFSLLQACGLTLPLNALNLGASDQTAETAGGGGSSSGPANDNSGFSLIQLADTGIPVNAGNLGDSAQSVTPGEPVTPDETPTIAVDKSASPASLPAPGGSFNFTLSVTNTSSNESVTITSLTDDVYGDLNTYAGSNCNGAVGQVLMPGGSYGCSFVGEFNGVEGDSQTDEVSAIAVDDDGDEAVGSAQATVTLTAADETPRIRVDKSAAPSSLPEPGGSFTFTVGITNTSVTEAVTITSVSDDVHSDLGDCDDLVGDTIPAGGSTSCSFTAGFTGNPGDSQTDVVTVTVVDDDGDGAVGSDDATVTITDVASSMRVDKTADPASLPEPGGAFTFDVVVTNTSTVDTITITDLADDVYGSLAGLGSCATAVGTVLAPGEGYACSFDGMFTGDGGDSQTDTVTATATDDDGVALSAGDDATVTITDIAPTIRVRKNASPPSMAAPGGVFSFNVMMTNTSGEAVTITSVKDSVYGDVDLAAYPDSTCDNLIGDVVAANASRSCDFKGTFEGEAGASETNTATVTVIDNDGTTGSGSDTATVSLR